MAAILVFFCLIANLRLNAKPKGPIDHSTVVCLVSWPLNESEPGVDFALIETSQLFLYKFLLISMTTTSLT